MTPPLFFHYIPVEILFISALSDQRSPENLTIILWSFSMDWFTGKNTGNPQFFSWENLPQIFSMKIPGGDANVGRGRQEPRASRPGSGADGADGAGHGAGARGGAQQRHQGAKLGGSPWEIDAE